MTLHDPAVPTLSAPALCFAPALFAATLFASALLLFGVQPMFTKNVLPMLGGAPSVWSVAMVFFQAALLIGYAYAHLLARTLSVGQGALVHLGVLAAAAFTLPIGIAQGFGAPPSSGVGLWLVYVPDGLFAVVRSADPMWLNAFTTFDCGRCRCSSSAVVVDSSSSSAICPSRCG